MWSKEDSNNLSRLVTAIEILAGAKTFQPRNERLKIEVEEREEPQDEIDAREAEAKKMREIFAANPGNHLWEETNLEAQMFEDENEQ
jgi:hypothetical protein